MAIAAVWLLMVGPATVGPAIVMAAAAEPDRLDQAAEPTPWTPPGVCVEYTPLENRLFAAADEGRLDWRWLLAAALAAGGERDKSRIASALREVESWGELLADEGVRASADVRRQAETVLDFLHARVLRGGYRSEATALSLAFEGRGYNCVGATVLFYCLAECCGLSVSAAESPGHVYALVRTADSETGTSNEIVVETTCRDWFRTASSPYAGRRPGPTRELSPPGLAALVYYNAGVDLLAERRFAAALAANLKALRLDPANTAARGNLLAGLNNWALEFNHDREFAAAARLLEHGLRMAPEHRPFRVNYVAVHQRWIEALVESERYETALDRLAIARGELPDEIYFESAAADLQRRFAPRLEAPDSAQ